MSIEKLAPWGSDGRHIFADTREQVCCGRGRDECCGEPDVEGSIIAIATVESSEHVDLICAAPELFDALQMVEDAYRDNLADTGQHSIPAAALAKIRAALAKANGETK